MKRKVSIFLLMLIFTLIPSILNGQNTKQYESYYQDSFAKVINGETEIILEDRTRVDIVTDKYAIEVDFGYKWAESYGQAKYYSQVLNKKAGILLVIDLENENRFIDRLVETIQGDDVKIWIWDYKTDEWFELELFYTYKLK